MKYVHCKSCFLIPCISLSRPLSLRFQMNVRLPKGAPAVQLIPGDHQEQEVGVGVLPGASAGGAATGGNDRGTPRACGPPGANAAPSVGGAEDGAPAITPPSPLVLLDLYHAEKRLIDRSLKSHGAYRPFCAALRDALAIADPESLKRAKEAVRAGNPTWDDTHVHEHMRANFSKVLKNVPRVVPQPAALIERFDNVIRAFKNVIDPLTGSE